MIKTKRTILRKFKMQDKNDMFINWAKDEEVGKYMLFPLSKTLEDSEKAIKSFMDNDNIIAIEYNGHVIGSITYTINKKHSFAEISYLLGKKYWNKKIMSECLSALIHKATDEDKIHMLIAEVMIENKASIKLLEKFNFKKDGKIRQKYKDRYGNYHDILIYTLILND